MSRDKSWQDPILVAQGKKRAERALRALNQDVPGVNGYPDVKFDREQAFVLYATFSGDVEKTAFALGADRLEVIATANAGKWQERLEAIFKLKQIGRPGDIERGINRANNFAQASRMRLFFEKLVHRLYTMTDEELDEYCFSRIETTDKAGNVTVERKLNTRPFADFASALEKVHSMTYAALGDTAGERTRRAGLEEDRHIDTKDIHAAIADAVSKAAGDASPRALMFEEQLAQVEHVMEGRPPSDPEHRIKPPAPENGKPTSDILSNEKPASDILSNEKPAAPDSQL